MMVRLFIFCVLLISLVTGCEPRTPVVVADPTPTPTPEFHNSDPEAEANRLVWNKSGFRDYDIEMDGNFGSGIGGPANNIQISVRNGVAVSVVSRRSIDTRPVDAYRDVETIEKMFEYIETLKKRQETSPEFVDAFGGRYPAVRVTYDKKLGYPKRIGILWTVAADANTSFEVKKFTPISN